MTRLADRFFDVETVKIAFFRTFIARGKGPLLLPDELIGDSVRRINFFPFAPVTGSHFVDLLFKLADK